MGRLLAFALFACAGASAGAQAPVRDAHFEAYVDAVVEAAAASRNPRVLLAAAYFAVESRFAAVPSPLAARRDALVARAMRLGADDPAIWFALAADCPMAAAACASTGAVERLRRLAPNNAVAWLLDGGAGDDAAANFARAVRANRYEQYEGELVRALYDAARLVPPPTEFVAQARARGASAPEQMVWLTMALGKWMALAHPHAAPVVQRCGDGNGLEGDARADCIAIGRLLAYRSRSVLSQRIGLRLLAERLPDDAERRDVLAARRRLEWMLEKHIEVAGIEEYPASALYWLQATGDELSVLRATLRENGLPEDPPPGWQSRSQSVLPALAPGAG